MYTTVDEIVNNLLVDQNQFTSHGYLRLLHIANRGLKDLTFDILGSHKVVNLVVDNSMRVDLPEDFIDYTFIGVINGDNRVEPLGFNRQIPLVGNVNDQTSFDDSFYFPNGGLYGLGGGQNSNGYYSPIIDIENNQLILASVYVEATIYLMYISDGRAVDGLTTVHPYAEEALQSWIYWKSIQRDRSYPQNEKQFARRDYYNDKRIARARLKSFTKEEAMQQFRKAFKQSPRL